ncbi:MAG: site-specific integrase [Candidatus Acidiferrales bacterium]
MPTSKRKPAQKLNFTKRALEELEVPAGDDRLIVFDTKTAGLGFVVFVSGARSFFHRRRVRGIAERTTLGKFDDLTIEQARGEASSLNARIAAWKLSDYQDESPFEKRPDAATFGELVDRYIERHVQRHASRPARAVQEVRWAVDRHLASWKNVKLSVITRSDMVKVHENVGREHRIAANRLVQLVRRLYSWAESPDVALHRGENPARHIKLFHESRRTRFLKPAELYSLFTALKKEPNASLRDYVNLALWTGARRGDLLSMRWKDLGLDDNRWEIPHPKNRTPYVVPLTPEAVSILRDRRKSSKGSEWVFPSKRGSAGHLTDFKRGWTTLLKRAGLADKDLRQHDLRRTLGSYQAAGGTSLGIIGKSLGHKSLAATAIYAQLDLDPVRESVLSATRTIIAASKKKPKQLKAGQS